MRADLLPGFARSSLDVGGERLSYVDDGARDGKPILFVHGNPTWSYLWRNLMGPARDAGFRVVAPDHIGFGMSDKPTKPSYYTLAQHVANLRSLVRHLDLRDATLVLHDWGGPIGMGLAVQEPDRIARLCICNTVAFAPKEERPLTNWHKWLASPWGYQLGVWFNVVERSAFKFGIVKPLPPDVRRAYDAPMKARGGRVAASRFVQMVPDGPEHPEAKTLRSYQADYPKLASKPMLVLWADKDRVMRARFAQRWLDDFPDATIKHVAPEAGHYWQEDAPERFLPHILAFSAGRDP